MQRRQAIFRRTPSEHLQMEAERAAHVRDLESLAESVNLTSWEGRLLGRWVRVRQVITGLMYPILTRQTRYNDANLRMIHYLIDRVSEQAEAIEYLEERLDALSRGGEPEPVRRGLRQPPGDA